MTTSYSMLVNLSVGRFMSKHGLTLCLWDFVLYVYFNATYTLYYTLRRYYELFSG